MRLKSFAWGVVLALGAVPSVFAQQPAPSFSCSKAATPLEKTICSDGALASMDHRMAREYRARLAGLTDNAGRKALLHEQRTWLKGRVKKCSVSKGSSEPGQRDKAVECLIALYVARIEKLTQDAVVEGPQSFEVSAVGVQDVVFDVPAFGRYAVVADSRQGTGLQIVDKVNGPGPIDGEAGVRNGRYDGYFDSGSYKAILYSSEHGNGEVAVGVHRFTELDAGAPLQLVDHKVVSTDLDDFQTRSYWLEVKSTKEIVIEAAGRNLADLGIWRDGFWRVDATATRTSYDMIEDRPLNGLQMQVTLQPGLYKFSFYGGPSRPWADGAGDGIGAHPLFIRMGVPELPVAGRLSVVTSPFGVDRYRLPADSNYFRLSLPDPAQAKLMISRSLFGGGRTARITTDSREPFTELTDGGGTKYVSIHRQPGERYVFTHFHDATTHTFRESGTYWIGILPAHFKDDTPGTTAFMIEQRPGQSGRMIRSRLLSLSRQSLFEKQFNVSGRSTLFVSVTQDGKYTVKGEGVPFRHRFQLIAARPKDYRAPTPKSGTATWDLATGLYLFEMLPEDGHDGVLSFSVAGEIGNSRVTLEDAVSWPSVALDDGANYRIDVNPVSGARTGLVLRQLPLDPMVGLPVNQEMGQTITIPVRVTESGELRLDALDGGDINATLNGGAMGRHQHLEPGSYDLQVSNLDTPLLRYQVSFAPDRLIETAPLPPVPSALLESLPEFPELAPGTAQFADADVQNYPTYKFRVEEPALYRLESSGLLRTKGALRTRVVTRLDEQTANGVGRNFLIQRYLAPGDYQVTVAPTGKSAGHMGVRLATSPLQSGGSLPIGETVRARLQAGRGMVFSFSIAEPGRYDVRALGLKTVFPIRLEDDQGWPIVTPGREGDLTLDLAKGRYRLVVLPQALDSRLVVSVDAEKAAPDRTGHGPHDLALNGIVDHVWMEPDEGAERTPDTWRFALPAPSPVTLTLAPDMRGRLQGPGHSGTAVSETWHGDLQQGEYLLEVVGKRVNNRLPYTVGMKTNALLVGMDKVIAPPQSVPLSLAEDALVELYSEGRSDVKARLYDETGALVAFNDDRENDWNFLIARRLPKGQYRLQVDPVAGRSGTVGIALRQPHERLGDPISIPGSAKLDGAGLHTFPLLLPKTGDVIRLSARSSDAVGLSLERNDGRGWDTVATRGGINASLLFVRGKGDFRLRVWPMVKGRGDVSVDAAVVQLRDVDEGDLADGLVLPASAGEGEASVVFRVELDRPGLFTVPEIDTGLMWGGAPGKALSPLDGRTFAATKTLYVARVSGSTVPLVTATREQLRADGAVRVALDDRRATFETSPGDAGPILITATADNGIPLVRVGSGISGQIERMAAGVAVSGDSLEGVVAWNADREGMKVPVVLTRTDFPEPVSQTLSWGVDDILLSGRSAVRLVLPDGPKTVRVVLPPKTVAAVLEEGQVAATLIADRQAVRHELATGATALLILRDGLSDSVASVAVSRRADASPVLAENGAVKRMFGEAGVSWLRVAAPTAPCPLTLFGDGVQGTFLGDGGNIVTGRQMMVENAGWLRLDHRSGVGVAIFGDLGSVAVPPDAYAAPTATTQVLRAGNSAFDLAVSTSASRFQTAFSQPALLTVLADMSSEIAIVDAGDLMESRFLPQAGRVRVVLPDGKARVSVQAMSPGRLSIEAQEVRNLKEGLGAPVMMGPGDTRAFTFAIEEETDIGLGVGSTTGQVSGCLLDTRGREVDCGVIMKQHLEPGRYFLVLSLSQDAVPSMARPALVGSTPPDSGPPQKDVEKYLKLSGLKAGASGG